MRIDIEDVLNLVEQVDKINSADLKEIELYFDGKKVNISQKNIEDFQFVGLSNFYFIRGGFWKEGQDER